MSVKPAQIFNYFRDCYRADHETLRVRSIFAAHFKNKHILKGDERILEQSERFTAFDHPHPERIITELEQNKLELNLNYTALYILGKDQTAFGKERVIASPLLFIPVKLHSKTELTIEVLFSESSLNLGILQKLELRDGLEHADFIEAAENLLALQKGVYGLKTLLEKHYQGINCQALVDWPKLWSANKMQKEVRQLSTEDGFIIVPASGYLLVPKNQHSLNVLNDLEYFSEQNAFSTPLEEIFRGQFSANPSSDSWFRHKLNTEQYSALQNAFKYQNSVIVGPPGTGKSYTIANIAAEAISRKESVLIASRNRPAVSVIREILESEFDLKDYLVQTSSPQYLRSLKAKITRFLSGIQSRQSAIISDHELESVDQKIKRAEASYLKHLNIELKRLKNHRATKVGLKEILQYLWLNNYLRDYEKFLEDYLESLNLRIYLQGKVAAYINLKIRYHMHLYRNSHRDTIIRYKEALESSNFTELKSILEKLDYNKLLDVFPIWLVHLQELNAVLPQKKELFDLVIIDEASQVDIAQALPAIQRAKRVVIVGDPMQLRHYSFLSKQKQRQFQIKRQLPDKIDLNYRDKSILDLYLQAAQEQDQISFLREHFRSSPLLIGFSNQAFYNNQLEVLKSKPEQLKQDQIELHPLKGLRNKEGVNEEEAQAILDRLKELINVHAELKDKPSIGVLSPFASQVRYLRSFLQEQLNTNEIKAHNILIGGPYHFQGSERDIILLSFSVDDQSHSAAFHHLNKKEVFNVSISRAKSKIMVFHSLDMRLKNDDGLLPNYLRFLGNQKQQEVETKVKDAFALEVKKALKRYKGFEAAYEAMPIAGMVLDLVIRYKGKYYFIDLIGYPGDFEDAFQLDRYQSLSRVGIYSIPLHYSMWKKNVPKARIHLRTALDKLVKIT